MRFVVLTLLVVALGGCATPRPWPDARDSRVQLDAILAEWREMREAGLSCQDSERHDNVVVDCGRLRDGLERVSLEFPRDPELQFASAVLAYETGEREQAQFYLDMTLSRDPGHVEAAVLRSRIALEEGNAPFAERLLDRTIEVRPEAPGLREARAAVGYALRDWEEARRSLDVAARLGAPEWRVEYHRGLIAEGEGDLSAAKTHYGHAAAARPDWTPPRARIRGIEAERP